MSQKIGGRFSKLVCWSWMVLLLSGVFLHINSTQAHAADVKGAKFSVNLIYPQQQSDHSSPGFNVLLSPNETMDLGFELHNKSSKSQEVVIRPTNATTSAEGEIDYQDEAQIDSSLRFPFTKMGARTQKVTLPPNKTVKIVQRVKMTGAPFDGVVLGGYTLSSAESTLAQAKKSGKLTKKTGFVNNFAYSVGVLIIAGHSEQVQPDFRLRKVGPRVVNAQSALLYQLQNFQPMYIQNRGLKVTGQMTPRGSSKIIISNSLAMSFAPNSTASILMKFGSQQVPAGKFTLHVVAKSDGRAWQFKRDFSISNAEANRLNKSNASVKQSLLWLWILIGLFILLVATILVVWLYRRAVKRGQLEARKASWKKN